MVSRTLAVVCLWCVFIAAVHAEENLWSVNLEQSKAQAAKEGKDLLIYMSGSDWCGPCIQLHNNVLTKPAFLDRVPKDFDLVLIDYPQDTSKQTKAEIEQNKRMKKVYPHRGVPTIFLADAKGRPYYAAYGYEGEPAEDFVNQLLSKRQIRDARDELFEKADAADGEVRAKLLDDGVSTVMNALQSSFNVAHYQIEIDHIIASDADGKLGLKAKYEGIIRLTRLIQQIKDIRAQSGEKGAKATLDALRALLTNSERSEMEQAHIHYALTFESRRDGQRNAALEHAKKVLQLAPDSDLAVRIKQVFNL